MRERRRRKAGVRVTDLSERADSPVSPSVTGALEGLGKQVLGTTKLETSGRPSRLCLWAEYNQALLLLDEFCCGKRRRRQQNNAQRTGRRRAQRLRDNSETHLHV